jgi:hypothetical protein
MNFDETERLMGALLRMPPKQHEDMKVSQAKRRKAKSPAKRLVKKSSGSSMSRHPGLRAVKGG